MKECSRVGGALLVLLMLSPVFSTFVSTLETSSLPDENLVAYPENLLPESEKLVAGETLTYQEIHALSKWENLSPELWTEQVNALSYSENLPSGIRGQLEREFKDYFENLSPDIWEMLDAQVTRFQNFSPKQKAMLEHSDREAA